MPSTVTMSSDSAITVPFQVAVVMGPSSPSGRPPDQADRGATIVLLARAVTSGGVHLPRLGGAAGPAVAPADDVQRRGRRAAFGAVDRLLRVRPRLGDLLRPLLVDGPVTPTGATQVRFRAASRPCGDGVPPGEKRDVRVDATRVRQPVRAFCGTWRHVDASMATCRELPARPLDRVPCAPLTCSSSRPEGVAGRVGGPGSARDPPRPGVLRRVSAGMSPTRSGDVRDSMEGRPASPGDGFLSLPRRLACVARGPRKDLWSRADPGEARSTSS